MNKRKALELHLFEIASLGEWYIQSSLIRGLQAARELTGRDKKFGQKISGQSHGSWLGALGYMTILDQIGTCFRPLKPKRTAQVKASSIVRALIYFTNLDDGFIDALYALRCAFAHDYSLCNIHPRRPALTHQFAVTQGMRPKTVLQLPKHAWNGDFNSKNPENQTVVNLERFGDLVEKIYKRLLSMFRQYQLTIALDGGPQELINRYQIWTKNHPKTDGSN